MAETVQERMRRKVSGRAVPVRGDDIDTDRIIPARYLKCITFDELGQYAFNDERYDEAGNPKPHPFNDERFAGAEILLVNRNFGCGSSREHAPQSLMRGGIRAIVGESFAEIFQGNCTALGIPTMTVRAERIEELMELVERNPDTVVTADVENSAVIVEENGGEKRIDAQLNDSIRKNLVEGTWDTTSLLRENIAKIQSTARKLPYIAGY